MDLSVVSWNTLLMLRLHVADVTLEERQICGRRHVAMAPAMVAQQTFPGEGNEFAVVAFQLPGLPEEFVVKSQPVLRQAELVCSSRVSCAHKCRTERHLLVCRSG